MAGSIQKSQHELISVLFVCIFVRREATTTALVIQGLRELDLSVDAQMAGKANPCSEGSLAVWAGDGRNVW